jgi:ATP-dependent DNA helicase DinG
VLPPPIDFGAPAKFTEWRPEQEDALLLITGTDKRFVGLNMPTGSGKSLVSHMLGKLYGRILVLTSQKTLQDQMERDQLIDTDIRGQQNYECLAVRRYGPLAEYGHRNGAKVMVDKAPCHVGVHCWMKFGGCKYFDKVRLAKETPGVVSTNYSYWLALGKALRDGRVEDQLGQFDAIVCDEAHSAINEVCSALRIELPIAELSSMLGLRPLPLDATLDRWRLWGEAALFGWSGEMDRLNASLKNQYIDLEVVGEYKKMQRIGSGLEQVATLSGDWVVGQSWKGDKITFDPVWPTSYTEQLLFRNTEKVVFMSATIAPKTLNILGVSDSEREYVEYPSSFPLESRPTYIYSWGDVPKVDFKMSEESEYVWLNLIDDFIGERIALNRKGIIHGVSYARMERILLKSKYKELFITNKDSTQTQAAIESYKKSKLSILLSPSVTQGEDFPDDECRWIVIPKLPFADSRDPVLQRREQSDPGYGGLMMIITLAQSVGRGPRSKTDWSEAAIIDGHARWALDKYHRHAPKYFRDSWKWVAAPPRPLFL